MPGVYAGRMKKEKQQEIAHKICKDKILKYRKEKKILTLEQMIHKTTSLTAERLLVANKGLLKAGCDADLLIFDYDKLKDLSTYDDPNRLTERMDYVIVGGQVVYHDMKFTGAYPGKFVPHQS